MSSYNLKMTLNSWMSEQAYLPFMSPVRACVCSVGSKGSEASLTYKSVYAFLRLGFFYSSFFARLRKVLSGSSFQVIGAFNSLNEFFRRAAPYGIRILFGLQHPFNEGLAPALPVCKISGKISDFVYSRCGKFGKDVFDTLYLINRSLYHITSQFRSGVLRLKKSCINTSGGEGRR